MRGSYSVIVIGAGLAGLTAALKLQKEGQKVLIVEQDHQPGGLCGSVHIGGYEFVKACNDFGNGLQKIFTSLRIPVEFIPSKLIFHVGDRSLTLNSSRLALTLLPYLPDLTRAIYAIRNNTHENLAELIDTKIQSSWFKDLLAILSYALTMAPADVSLRILRENFSNRYGYGYEKTVVPVGGPGKMMNTMAEVFTKRGGTIVYDTKALDIRQYSDYKRIVTNKDVWIADEVISSIPRWDLYPSDYKESLHINVLHVALRKNIRFPRIFTTLTIMPEGVDYWLTRLDQGARPHTFGFHVVKSLLSEKEDYVTVNVYFLAPRGLMDYDELTEQETIRYIYNRIEEHIPGFQDAVLFHKLVSPSTFKALYGVSSQQLRYILPENYEKPPIYDPDKDLYHVGNSAYPPGEHAGAAALSGWQAATMILEKNGMKAGKKWAKVAV